jgi:bifunctional non-homologous end joining protein LigD
VDRADGPAQSPWRPLPRVLPPMLAVPGELPPSSQERQWAYETKWDGARAVVFVDGGRPRALSRNDREVTGSYPELQALAAALGTTQIALDGEIVAFGQNGRPSFSRLQRRMHVSDAAQVRRLAVSDPVVYLVFDLLHLDGRSTLQLPYTERRRLLESLNLNGDSWHTPGYFTGSGADLLSASKEQGLEGIVAKRLDSPYRPGRRSPDWRKIKNIRTQEVIVGGWRPGNGRRSGTIGSLLMGVPDDHGLQYVGSVGTGFSEVTLADLLARLQRLSRASSPFASELPRADSRDAHWVRPSLVGEVTYTERTPDGRLRHPSWRGLRPDKSPSEVRPEP